MFEVFVVFVPTVLADALFIHLILTDQWLFDMFLFAKMPHSRSSPQRWPGGASERHRILVSPPYLQTRAAWTSPWIKAPKAITNEGTLVKPALEKEFV